LRIFRSRFSQCLFSDVGRKPVRDSAHHASSRAIHAAGPRAALLTLTLLGLELTGCAGSATPQAAQQPQALPVQVATVASVPVPQSDQYIATIKSRRSATITPQVDGNLVAIAAHSGDRVRAGQILLEIDPSKQEATLASAKATELQKLAVYEYDQVEQQRQQKLFDQGVTSRDTLDQANQAFKNSKADYDSAVASTLTQEKQLGYYHIAAPFDGMVGDIPVHLGDYVSTTTLLTTVDASVDLEAYIYIPTERAGLVRKGLAVEISDNSGKLLERTTIDFLSLQVQDQLQGILAKAPVHSSTLRSQEQVLARVIWKTAPQPVIPVLAVTQLGGQTFVYVAQNQGGKYFARQRAVAVGDTVGNKYPVISGLQDGDKVIVSGTQFLVDGMPVQPLS
jgi:RND family efflux transporter MFP subunit